MERREDVAGLAKALSRRELISGRDGRPVDLAARDRSEAAEALGRLACPEALPELEGALDDPVPPVRLAVVDALAQIALPESSELLGYAALSLSAAEDQPARERAVTALETRSLSVTSEVAQRLAVRTLEAPSDEWAFTRIIVLIRDSLDDDAIGTLCRQCLPALSGDDVAVRGRAERLLIELGPAVLDHLAPAFEDQALAARLVLVLGELRDARGTPILVEQLASADPTTRSAAAVALARVQDPRAIYALLGSTVDPVHEVRAAAIRALDAFGPVPAVMVVGQLLRGALTQGGADQAELITRLLESGPGSELHELRGNPS